MSLVHKFATVLPKNMSRVACRIQLEMVILEDYNFSWKVKKKYDIEIKIE